MERTDDARVSALSDYMDNDKGAGEWWWRIRDKERVMMGDAMCLRVSVKLRWGRGDYDGSEAAVAYAPIIDGDEARARRLAARKAMGAIARRWERHMRYREGGAAYAWRSWSARDRLLSLGLSWGITTPFFGVLAALFISDGGGYVALALGLLWAALGAGFTRLFMACDYGW